MDYVIQENTTKAGEGSATISISNVMNVYQAGYKIDPDVHYSLVKYNEDYHDPNLYDKETLLKDFDGETGLTNYQKTLAVMSFAKAALDDIIVSYDSSIDGIENVISEITSKLKSSNEIFKPKEV